MEVRNKNFFSEICFYVVYFITARPEENNSFCTLPEDIQKLKDGIQSKQQQINQHFQRIIDQIFEISQVRYQNVLSLCYGTSLFKC